MAMKHKDWESAPRFEKISKTKYTADLFSGKKGENWNKFNQIENRGWIGNFNKKAQKIVKSLRWKPGKDDCLREEILDNISGINNGKLGTQLRIVNFKRQDVLSEDDYASLCLLLQKIGMREESVPAAILSIALSVKEAYVSRREDFKILNYGNSDYAVFRFINQDGTPGGWTSIFCHFHPQGKEQHIDRESLVLGSAVLEGEVRLKNAKLTGNTRVSDSVLENVFARGCTISSANLHTVYAIDSGFASMSAQECKVLHSNLSVDSIRKVEIRHGEVCGDYAYFGFG